MNRSIWLPEFNSLTNYMDQSDELLWIFSPIYYLQKFSVDRKSVITYNSVVEDC